MIRRVLPILVILCSLLWNRAAHASHYRGSSLGWTVPDPQAASLAVQFTVTSAWRTAFIATTALDFGDGSPLNPLTLGNSIGTGTDSIGQSYTVEQYTVIHTYAAAGTYTASLTGCCYSGQNGPGSTYVVQSTVSLTPGNSGGPAAPLPEPIQLQTGGVRTCSFPAFDQDGDVVSCRFATPAESGLPPGQNIPSALPTNLQPTLVSGPTSCTLSWDLAGATAGAMYNVAIVFESTHGGQKSGAAIDVIAETVSPPAPACTGAGTFVVNVGQAFSVMATGTLAGSNLTMSTLGAPQGGAIAPPSGDTAPSPFTSTFSWTPLAADAGKTAILAIDYTSVNNITGTCSLTIHVPQCPSYGAPCSVGVGECATSGVDVCAGPSLTVCDAIPGQPQPEVCDGKDNDCNGQIDEDDPGVGQACPTGLPGVCSVGAGSSCQNGALACASLILPGQQAEICGDNLDSDCDGADNNGCQCLTDQDCGDPKSGMVCENSPGATFACVLGCRGVGGNGCPDPDKCTSIDSVIGMCLGDAGGSTGTGTGTGSGGGSAVTGAGGATGSGGDTSGGGRAVTGAGEAASSGGEASGGGSAVTGAGGATGSGGEASDVAFGGCGCVTVGTTTSTTDGLWLSLGVALLATRRRSVTRAPRGDHAAPRGARSPPRACSRSSA